MKANYINNEAVKLYLLVAIVIATLNISVAQEIKNRNIVLPEYAVKNFINGIRSENEGVKYSSIYLAGKYKVSGTVDALIERLKIDDDLNCRFICAVSLIMIGEERGIKAAIDSRVLEVNASAKEKWHLISSQYEDRRLYAK